MENRIIEKYLIETQLQFKFKFLKNILYSWKYSETIVIKKSRQFLKMISCVESPNISIPSKFQAYD